MNQTERKDLNNLTIDLSREAGERILKVPGIHAVLLTLVGEQGTPIGVLVYDKQHQSSDLLVHAIARLSEHITLLAQGLTGDSDEQVAHVNLGKQEEVPGESDVRPQTRGDSPPIPRGTADE